MDERSSSPSGTPAAAAPAPPPAAKQPTAAQSVHGVNRAVNAAARKDDNNVKETIESILVAFILAFIFRAFIVEAFVIPTGSMAPTLLGAHLRWSCNDCGYRFDTNYNAHRTDADGNPIIPNRSGPIFNERTDKWERNEHEVRCPNCGFDVPRREATDVRVNYGDRILVLKYLYLFQDPKRWDVVVFKSPHDPKYQQNYIKRMVGRPNESVLILDGDIYIGPPGATSLDQFVIQPKPKHVQDALWRVIYDNDYHPRGLTRGQHPWRQPWTVRDGSGWTLDDDGSGGAAQRVFAFDNLNAGGTIFFDREAIPSTHPFSDWLAYDVEDEDRLMYTPSVAGDLRVKLDYLRTAGAGPLRVKLSKMDDTFIAELNPYGAKLFRKTGDGAETELASKSVAFGNDPLRIEFENVDHQVTLRVNGDVLLRTTPEQYSPDVRQLLEQFKARQSPPLPGVEISAEQQTSQISHLSLWRDVYYLNGGTRGGRMWASPLDFPSNVIHLGPDEYFVLGDNSLASLDARMWTKDIELPDLRVESGRVPERFMLGKAFFVYWPAGYKPLASESIPALTPNFGDMRFIR